MTGLSFEQKPFLVEREHRRVLFADRGDEVGICFEEVDHHGESEHDVESGRAVEPDASVGGGVEAGYTDL